MGASENLLAKLNLEDLIYLLTYLLYELWLQLPVRKCP